MMNSNPISHLSLVRWIDHPIWGRTLELNVLGSAKVCSFDCSFCSLGPSVVRLTDIKKLETLPTVDAILNEFRKQLTSDVQAVHSGPAQTSLPILISGNGEPTLHPKFSEIISALKADAELFGRKLRFHLMTNGAHLGERHVRSALAHMDELIVQFSWITEAELQADAKPKTRIQLEDLVSLAATSPKVHLQVLVRGQAWQEQLRSLLADWLELVKLTRPKGIYLIPFEPTSTQDAAPTSDELHTLAHWIERQSQVRVTVIEVNSRAVAA